MVPFAAPRLSVVLALVGVVLFRPVLGLRWHQGCMCELPDAADDGGGDEERGDDNEGQAVPSAAEMMFATSAIFSGSKFFRRGGEISEFCPCSLESIQASR